MEREAGVTIAGRYRLVEKLGSGGMGSVWLADDLSLDSPCAVKLIDPEKSRSDEVRKRFVREAKAAAQLRGPHVVDVFDRGECDGILYIAMEYLEGEDLCTRLGRVGALEPEKTYRVVAHVSRALSSAHALGIVHRDLKPENIFLVQSYDEEIAKVLDFGIAQHAAYRLEDRATREGTFLGTPYYVSPEQARGRPTDHRSDLWSLAVITYQSLTGVPPFDSDSLGDLMGLILYEPIPRITDANPNLPRTMEDWWTRATQRDRELRFQSARELSDHLGRALCLKTVVTVPTLPPRRHASYADDGESRLASGSIPPLGPTRTPPLPQQNALATAVGLRVASSVGLPDLTAYAESETAAVSAADPLSMTNLVVSRTRPSLRNIRQSIDWGYGVLKTFPKRPLVLVAVGLGLFLGAMLTLTASSRPQRVEALAPETNSSTSPPTPVGTQLPLVSETATPASSVATAGRPEVLPVPSPSFAEPRRSEPPTKKPPTTSVGPRKPPAGTPDYGI